MDLEDISMDFYGYFVYNVNRIKYFCKGGLKMKGLDVAKYIIDKCYREGKTVTNLHLQKILYFVQGEYYKKTKKFLIDDNFLAWKYGPVLKDVYEEYSWYYSSRIYESHSIDIPQEVKDIIDPVIEEKRNKTAGALVNETHKPGGAWDQCYDGNKRTIIPRELIKADFS